MVFSHHIRCGQLISNDRADAVQERSYHEASGGPLSVKPRESFRTSKGSLDQTVVALSLSLFVFCFCVDQVLRAQAARLRYHKIQQHLTHAKKSQTNALKIHSELQTPQGGTKEKEGTPSFRRHTMSNTKNFEGNWPASTTQKGSPLTFLLFRISHHILLLRCPSSSTVRKRRCCCDTSTRELPWHSEHRERGKS